MSRGRRKTRAPTCREAARLVRDVVEEPISHLVPVKAVGYYAPGCGAHLCPFDGRLQKRANDEVDVIHGVVKLFQLLHVLQNTSCFQRCASIGV